MVNSIPAGAWHYRGAWDGIAVPGSTGRVVGSPIRIKPWANFGAALLIENSQNHEDFAQSLKAAYGLLPPSARRYVSNERLEMIWAGPGKWLALATHVRIAQELSDALKGTAAISDQSGSRGVLEISGKKARDLLAKGLAVDLHASRFKVGDVALSSIAHIGVHVWQTDEHPTYMLAVARSMTASFWSWLVRAGADLGLSVS